MYRFISILLLFTFCTGIEVSDSINEELNNSSTTTSLIISDKETGVENLKTYPVSKNLDCTSFESQDELLKWWKKYFPIYGDIAELDIDNDGIPCNDSDIVNMYSTKRETNGYVLELASREGFLEKALGWCMSDPFLNKETRPNYGTPEFDVWVDAKITRQVGEKAFTLVGDRWPDYLYSVITNNREALSSREFGRQLFLYYINDGNEEIYNALVPSVWTVQEAEFYGTTLYAEACLLAYDSKDNWFDRHEGWLERP